MKVVLDTNVLTRTIEPDHRNHVAACGAVKSLRLRGEELCVFPQVLYEFWVVCTRPRSEYNGFGMTTAQSLHEIQQLRQFVRLLRDPASLYEDWERIVVAHDVKGKAAHDARLVAAMHGHGLTHLLTFNAGDFTRFTEITVLSPLAVASTASEHPAPDARA